MSRFCAPMSSSGYSGELSFPSVSCLLLEQLYLEYLLGNPTHNPLFVRAASMFFLKLGP